MTVPVAHERLSAGLAKSKSKSKGERSEEGCDKSLVSGRKRDNPLLAVDCAACRKLA